MGYHRPVASFNIGKKGEHRERRFFVEERVRPPDRGRDRRGIFGPARRCFAATRCCARPAPARCASAASSRSRRPTTRVRSPRSCSARAAPGAAGIATIRISSRRAATTSAISRDILDWLGTRRGLLDAVVFSGGEPTAQPGLAGSDRAGSSARVQDRIAYRRRLSATAREVLPHVDWVGIDVKAPRAEYADRDRRSRAAGSPRSRASTSSSLPASHTKFERRCIRR